MLVYTGYDGSGDQGGLATSEDLVAWRFAADPILPHRTPRPFPDPSANAFWDGGHVRPRSLLGPLADGNYYLFYEGANTEPPGSAHMPGCWDDSVGLARSSDLVHWDTDWPLELALPQRPGDVYDACWTGFPKARLS